MIVIGLTGGIASGKSTILQMLIKKGIPVVDADLISRELVKPEGKVLKKLCNAFGDIIIKQDGTLDRRLLGTIVFGDSSRLKQLNDIMLPAIREEVVQQLKAYRLQNFRLCVVDGATLVESKFTDLVDYLLLVFIEPQLQLERLRSRDNYSEKEALERIQAQMPFEEKRKYADYIIDNSKDIEYTKQQLNTILRGMADMEGINV